MNEIEIGKKIANGRRAKGLSQADLAEILSMSKQAVGKWERGESMPDVIMLASIAKTIDVDINYFFAQTPLPTPSNKSLSQASGWNMSGSTWKDADFSGLNNLGDKLSGAHILGCRFIGSNLKHLRLAGNRMVKNDFSGSSLYKSVLKGSHALHNNFSNCQFASAKILANNIRDCDFSGADFSNTNFCSNHIERNIMSATKWDAATLKCNYFCNITFNGTFTNCVIDGCSFKKVIFQNVVFENTFVKNTNLKKVEFFDCKSDSITYAFLKNSKASLNGVTIIN